MNRSPFAALTAVLALVLTLGGCGGPSPVPVIERPTFSPSPTVAPTPAGQPDVTVAYVPYAADGRITGRQLPACHARGQLPDPACTPGAVGVRTGSEANDRALVCNAGFSGRHRPIGTGKAKVAAMKAYGIPTTDIRVVEYDHLIPLSLGGADDTANLWPQHSDLPNRGFHNSKDDVELRLWRAVCTGPVDKRQSLVKVQEAFARDWTAAEKFLGLSPG